MLACYLRFVLCLLCGDMVSCGFLASLGGGCLYFCCGVVLIAWMIVVLLLFTLVVVNSVDFHSSFCLFRCFMVVVLGMFGFAVCMLCLLAITYYIVVYGCLLICVVLVYCLVL